MQSRPAAGFLLHSQTAVRAPRTIRIPLRKAFAAGKNRELLRRTSSACKPSAEHSPPAKAGVKRAAKSRLRAKTVAQKNALRYNKPYARL